MDHTDVPASEAPTSAPTARRPWSTPEVILAPAEGTSVVNPTVSFLSDTITVPFGARFGLIS